MKSSLLSFIDLFYNIRYQLIRFFITLNHMQVFAKLANLRDFKAKKDSQYQVPVDIQKILKAVQGLKSKNQELSITQKQFITLCRMGRSLLLRQPSLLRLNGPIFIATGTLGYYKDLKRIISRCGHPDLHSYLFLGDYIGRGPRNTECLVLLICLKLKLQNNFFLLRGCYDSIAMARSYNFYDECIERFSPKAFTQACQFLCSLPFAAIVQNQIFCCHGGISPSLKSVQQINKITRPLETPQVGLACDLVWADPSYKDDSLIWQSSERGFSYSFHQKVAEQFLKQHRYSLLCRGHEVVYDGFYMNRQRTVATICSLADYAGLFNNSAAILVMNPQFQVYFKVIEEREHFPIEMFYEENASSLLKRVMGQKRQIKKKQMKQKQEQRLKAQEGGQTQQNYKAKEYQNHSRNRDDQFDQDQYGSHSARHRQTNYYMRNKELKQIQQQSGQHEQDSSSRIRSKDTIGLQLPNKRQKDQISKIPINRFASYEEEEIQQKQYDEEKMQKIMKTDNFKGQIVYIGPQQVQRRGIAEQDTDSLDQDKL